MLDPDTPLHEPNAAAAVWVPDVSLRVAPHQLQGPMAAVLLQVEDALTLVEPKEFDLVRLEQIGRLVQHLARDTTALLCAPRLAGGGFRLDASHLDVAEACAAPSLWPPAKSADSA